LVIPINHFSGAYVCDDETLARLEGSGQIVLRYVDNPNGSRGDIAGLANERGNVVGLMPHPERAMSTLLGSADGRVLLESFVAARVRA
jgi:phosphoribosylformylglycinamidine synthase